MFDVRAYFEGRENERMAFIQKHVLPGFLIVPVAEDWASRRYFRITQNGKSYILMEAVPDHIPVVTMGHKLSAFLKIASMLHGKGIHTPNILAKDEQEGFVLLEDLGHTSLHAALEQGGDEFTLYGAATDVLIAMRDNVPDNALSLPRYEDTYIYKGRQRIVDWYIPATRGGQNQDGLVGSYLAAWDDVMAQLPPPPLGLIHGDFHLQNLMLLKDGTCGVLDFQDAMWGPLSYDLANLLENIRRDVPKEIHSGMLERFGGGEAFRSSFRVMATQFHCRIIGQVLRLAVLSGKTELVKFMPRIQNYIKEGLKDPILKPLANWMKVERVDLDATGCFDPETIKKFIRPDAF